MRLEAERARQTSLLDVMASPDPGGAHGVAADPPGDSGGPSLQSSTGNQDGGFEENIYGASGSSDVGPLVPMEAGPKEASWKRIDFVLPRALNSQPFVFNQKQQQPDRGPANGHPKSLSSKTSSNKKSETLDDIFSSKKKSKMNGQQEQQQSADSNTTSNKSEQQVIPSARIRKLSDTFEEIYKEEQRKSKAAELSSFVEVPKSKKMKLPKQQQQQQEEQAADTDKDKKMQQLAQQKIDSPSESRSQSSRKMRQDHNTDRESYPGQISGRSVEEAVRDKSGLRPRANSTDGELNLPQRGLCDERMVLESHKWNVASKVVSQKSPKGFHNLGNTCFLNATLQCLAYLPPFCQTLIAIWESKMSDKKNGSTSPKLYPGQRVTSHLCSLFQRVHGLKDGHKMNEQGSALSPTQIAEALPMIGSCGSRNGYKFRLGRQEDSHEFLVHLLDAMNDGELRAAGINQHASGWRDRLPVHRLDETTFVHRIFGGYFRSQVRCRKCGYCSNTYDPFLDLSLEVSKKSCTSVLNALSEFTRKEILDEENQWKCSGCKKHVRATKQLTVFRPPLSLCIQLKRFTYDGGFGGGGLFGMGSFKFSGFQQHRGGSKITKPIQFPASLDLPLSDGRSCAYALTGVVIHVGGSASSGHYTACIRKAYGDGESRWYYIDDDSVEPISEKNVLRQKNAYLLFYCRKEVKLEFPSPPSRSMSADEAKEFGRARARARANSLSEEDLMERQKIYKSDSSQAFHSTLPAVDETSELSMLDTTIKQPGSQIQPTETEKHSLQIKESSHNKNHVNDENACSGDSTKNESLYERKRSSSATNSKSPTLDSSDDSSSQSSSSSSSTSSSSDSSDQPREGPKKCVANDLLQGVKANGRSIESKDGDSDTEGSFSSSSSSNSSSSDGDDNEDEYGKTGGLSKKITPSVEPSSSSASPVVDGTGDRSAVSGDNRTRVVIKNSNSREKLMVMMGKKKRAWASKASPASSVSRGHDYDLLGNVGVKRWDQEEDDVDDVEQRKKMTSPTQGGDQSRGNHHNKGRNHIVNQIEKEDRSRKRSMHLDRWDMSLDQGKVKKIKSSKPNAENDLKSNSFQRIQDSIRRMKGKPESNSRQQNKRRQHQGYKRPNIQGGRFTY